MARGGVILEIQKLVGEFSRRVPRLAEGYDITPNWGRLSFAAHPCEVASVVHCRATAGEAPKRLELRYARQSPSIPTTQIQAWSGCTYGQDTQGYFA